MAWRSFRRFPPGHQIRPFARAAAHALLVVLAVSAPAATESACTSARPVLTFFFDGVPAEGEGPSFIAVSRAPRREPYKKPDRDRPKIDLGEVREVVDWAARYAELPRTDAGDVAWVKALEDKLITPAPGLAADAKEEEATDMDVEFVPKDQPEYKAVFSHKVHTEWMGCPACHDAIFAMEKGKATMTMDKLNEGAYCGVCHGKVASPDLNGCAVCHTAMGKS
jgi:c(7)-type cytochrome triheme protein